MGDDLLRNDNAVRNAWAVAALGLAWVMLGFCGKAIEYDWLLLGFPLVCVLAAVALGVRAGLVRKRLRARAQLCHSVEEIGPLMDAAVRRPGHAGWIARDVLVRLLPAVRPENADLLEPRHREWMRRELGPALMYGRVMDGELCISILAALSQVGTMDAVPVVERIARVCRISAIRSAAAACLPALREHAEAARNSQTLLRAADDPASGQDVLLRPAGAAASHGSDRLLRPTDATGHRPESEP